MMAGLNLDVFNSGYRPVPNALPVWPDGWQATWPATTSTFISGERDGVLVDALATKGESQELADWLATTGKNLIEVYITHGHGDHFFGLNTVLDRFPKARAVALPELVPLLAEQATPEWMQIWNSFFPDQLFQKPVVPVALDEPELEVEGHPLHVLKLGQSDVADSTAVHVPDLDTLLPGDVIYNGIHPWMYGSDHALRMDWIETVNEVEKLGVKTILAGHADPAAADNEAARLIEATRQYIYDFDEAVALSSGGEEVVSKMTAKYPDLGNAYTLWLAAYTQSYGD
jgi:glyoxylase-like metal-dependent hydrolase (beta-lactamase superfamily II)